MEPVPLQRPSHSMLSFSLPRIPQFPQGGVTAYMASSHLLASGPLSGGMAIYIVKLQQLQSWRYLGKYSDRVVVMQGP